MQRRHLLALAALSALRSVSLAAPAQAPVRTRVETALGSFVIAVDTAAAPVTAANFLAYVDARHLDDASVYRVVTLANQPPSTAHKIEVVQWGMNLPDGKPEPFPPIRHESTRETGLRHRDGTISMARNKPGSAASEFFICIGDQPELDFGGRRNPDGQGFAAFGQVVEGMDVVRALHAQGQLQQILSQPIPVRTVRRVTSAAEVRVMISAGFFSVYSQLAPEFERATGHRLVTVRGPSMGDSPEAIPARLARGELADVVILDGGAADELGRRGLLRADSKRDLARSLVGMVVRAGAPKPDIGSVDAFRATLLAAQSIAYSDSGSGTYLSTTLFARLGVADQVAGKSRKVRGPPSGEPVAAVVARGEAQIGFQQVSELLHVPGVSFVGPIPAELQPGFVFAGALTASVRQPEAAMALIRFLASPDAAPTILKAGLTPVSR